MQTNKKITRATGCPLFSETSSISVCPNGNLLMEDVQFFEEMAHFNRERIPERVVHAKGSGAFGYFQVTHDIKKYTASKIFSHVGKKTSMACRFSTILRERGFSDTVRDVRGFALKFYTEDGIWDLVGNNVPVFFVRDPMLFPHLVHANKRNPSSDLIDPNAQWDFFSKRPETLHLLLLLYSARGIPYGFRYMNGHGINTFKLINKSGKHFYCKFHYKSDQGIRNLDPDFAIEVGGRDPDYGRRDLYESIQKKDYPSWTFYIQIMTPEQVKTCYFDPFDSTKVWPKAEYPFIQVGKFVLNKNPENYFAEIEQLAFCPSNLIPGIEPSPDKVLQGRLFAYSDAQRYRLGANHLQLKVNCPFYFQNYQRDGLMTINNQGGGANYFPNSFDDLTLDERACKLKPCYEICGDVDRYETGDEDNYSQPAVFYRKVLNEDGKKGLARAMAMDLREVHTFILERAIKHFQKIDCMLAEDVLEAIQSFNTDENTKSSI